MDLDRDEALALSGLQNAIDNQVAINGLIYKDIEDVRFKEVHRRIRRAISGEAITWIGTGDSTLSNTVSAQHIFLTKSFKQLNVSYYNNARAGNSTTQWLNNIGTATINGAVANTSGVEGENTILSFQMGINDYNGTATKAQIKDGIKLALDSYILLKPKTAIVLVSPIWTGVADKNTTLHEIYEELSNEYEFPYIDNSIPSVSAQGNSAYYYDSTHPNIYGSVRMYSYMLSKTIPIELQSYFNIENYIADEFPKNRDNITSQSTASGSYWHVAVGDLRADSNWRYLADAIVLPTYAYENNWEINIKHFGNRDDILFYDENNVFLGNKFSGTTGVYRVATVPSNARFVRFNISSTGSTYDALTDKTVLINFSTIGGEWIDIDKIMSGLKLPNKINRLKNNRLIDDFGSIGKVGESLKIDANNKMKWSV